MSKKTILIILGIAAVFCCCISTVVGGIVIYNSQINKPAPTPSPLISTTPLVTGSTIVDPSSTISPTFMPSFSFGDFVFDAFNDNSKGWTMGKQTGDYSISDEYIEGGKLYLEFETINEEGAIVYDTLDKTFSGDKYEVSIDGKLQPDSTDTTDYGIIFRMLDKSNYYYFIINEHYQEFAITSKVNGEFTDITQDWVQTTLISSSTPNTIKVVADGTKFDFFINGQMVYTTTISSVPNTGKVGILGQSYEVGDKGTIAFDNLTVSVD